VVAGGSEAFALACLRLFCRGFSGFCCVSLSGSLVLLPLEVLDLGRSFRRLLLSLLDVLLLLDRPFLCLADALGLVLAPLCTVSIAGVGTLGW